MATEKNNRMKVKCIRDIDPNDPKLSEVARRILLVGDNHLLPKIGEVYEVIGYARWDEYEFPDGTKAPADAYELDIESSEHYGAKLVFSKRYFEVYDDAFVPNHVDDDGNLCRKVNMFASFKFDVPDGSDSQEGCWTFEK